MDAKEQLLQARRSLQNAVDKALEAMPEYRALQSVEQAIDALERAEKATETHSVESSHASVQTTVQTTAPQSYARLAMNAIQHAGRPLTTPEVIEFIGRYRTLSHDPERAKINIASALSKEDSLRSIGWKGGRAWWVTSEKVPLPRDLDSATSQE